MKQVSESIAVQHAAKLVPCGTSKYLIARVVVHLETAPANVCEYPTILVGRYLRGLCTPTQAELFKDKSKDGVGLGCSTLIA